METLFKLIASVLVGITSLFSTSPLSVKPSIPTYDYSPRNYVVFHGQRDRRVVALTFDADMTPKMKGDLEAGKVSSWYNNKVVQILEENNIPATFFLTGMWIELYPKETAELAKDPLFELGNHSYSHPAFEKKCTVLNYISNDKDYEEIEKTQKLLKDIAGIDNHLFRFPGGCYDVYDLSVVHKLGLDAIQWDISSSDAFNFHTQQLINNVSTHVQNGSIILMHMIGNRNAPKTSEALPTIISGLRYKGFDFVKVSELIK